MTLSSMGILMFKPMMRKSMIWGLFIATHLFSQIFASEVVFEGFKLPEKNNFHLFLLAGQSNMAGRGVILESDKQMHPKIFALSENGEWVPAVDPIHFDKAVAGLGLAKSFALRLLDENPDICIGLIPAACGGSPISSWEPGVFFKGTQSHPYDDAIKRANRATQDGVLKGILWHQGESDSNQAKAGDYKEHLRELIERFRIKLGDPELPFIIGQLGQFEERPWNEFKHRVDRAHRELAEEIPHVMFVSSDGLKSNPDLIHFNSDSLKILGDRYAKAYLNYLEDLKFRPE